MLTSCKQCDQVIEIHTLNEHLLEECEVQGTHGQCKKCKEAWPVKELAAHEAAGKCLPAKPKSKANRCPLCHDDIAPGDDGWKRHLLEGGGCPKNPRKPVAKK